MDFLMCHNQSGNCDDDINTDRIFFVVVAAAGADHGRIFLGSLGPHTLHG